MTTKHKLRLSEALDTFLLTCIYMYFPPRSSQTVDAVTARIHLRGTGYRSKRNFLSGITRARMYQLPNERSTN